MELFTPSDNPGYYAAGYNISDTLKDIVSVHMIDKDKEGERLHDQHAMTYLDYAMTDPSDDTDGMPTLGLVARTKYLQTKKMVLELLIDEDPTDTIENHLIDSVFGKILELSAKNKAEAESHFPTGIDAILKDKDEHSAARLFVSRIMTASSTIAIRGRRGPATFLIMPPKFAKYLEVIQKRGKLYQMNYTDLMGLKIYFNSELNNTVIVGRNPKDTTEPGLYLITSKQDITGEMTADLDGPKNATVRYILSDISDLAYNSYLQFDVIE